MYMSLQAVRDSSVFVCVFVCQVIDVRREAGFFLIRSSLSKSFSFIFRILYLLDRDD